MNLSIKLELPLNTFLPWRACNLWSFEELRNLSTIVILFWRSFSISSSPSGPSSSNSLKEKESEQLLPQTHCLQVIKPCSAEVWSQTNTERSTQKVFKKKQLKNEK